MKKINLLMNIVTFIITITLCSCVNQLPNSPTNDSTAKNEMLFLCGKGIPSNEIGINFSHYYDEESRFIYEKNDGAWINKFTIGNDQIYKYYQSNDRKMKRNLESFNEKFIVINALENTFYSTNISFDYSYVDNEDNVPDDTWGLSIKVHKEYTQIQSPQMSDFNEYLRTNIFGHEILVDGEYEKIMDYNPNLLSMIPFPSIDNIAFSNFGIYQEDLGQMTSIIISNINNAYYEETSGFYNFDQINIEHGELESNYITEADNLSFSFSIKLSENKEYVETAYLKILSSTIISEEMFENRKLKMHFYDYHQTKIELPL